MEIEAELPDDFDSLSTEKKIQHLEDLKDKFDESKDSEALKKRIVEELIIKYSDESTHESQN